MQKYAKLIVAILGAGVTAALGIVSPDTELFSILTIAAAMLTAYGVYAVPNDKPLEPEVEGEETGLGV